MRGWRRSSRASARDTSNPSAAAPNAVPNPFAPLAWPPPPVEALLVDPGPEPPAPAVAPAPPETPAAAVPPPEYWAPPESPVAAAVAPPESPAALEPQPPVATPPIATRMVTSPEANAELLRLFEVVTNMCDHVIEYIETDRAERRAMLETLATLGQTITASAAALAPLIASVTQTVEARVIEQPEPRERVVGGSMPAGPEPVIDLRGSPAPPGPTPVAAPAPALEQSTSPQPPTGSASVESAPAVEVRPATTTTSVMTTEIAVEVRGRFGDRWVDGFEICEVMETPEGHRYRLRRHRDGVVLPELFDATSIRHVETFDQLSAMNGANGHRVNGQPEARETNVTDATGYPGPSVNGASVRWSRS